jgi:hypothetical protein
MGVQGENAADGVIWRGRTLIARLEEPGQAPTLCPMHYDAHQPIINDIEARILTIRDSL